MSTKKGKIYTIYLFRFFLKEKSLGTKAYAGVGGYNACKVSNKWRDSDHVTVSVITHNVDDLSALVRLEDYYGVGYDKYLR